MTSKPYLKLFKAGVTRLPVLDQHEDVRRAIATGGDDITVKLDPDESVVPSA
jgi:CBS domain-containing protein